MIKSLAFVGAVGLALVSGPAVHAETLSQSQLKALFPGKYTVKIFGRYDVSVNMRPNGTVTGVAGKYRDTGRWTVENGKLCVAWSSWTSGRKGCSSLSRKGNTVSGRGFRFQVS
jgi:hypothetical protein